jgi:hypothetical protein
MATVARRGLIAIATRLPHALIFSHLTSLLVSLLWSLTCFHNSSIDILLSYVPALHICLVWRSHGIIIYFIFTPYMLWTKWVVAIGSPGLKQKWWPQNVNILLLWHFASLEWNRIWVTEMNFEYYSSFLARDKSSLIIYMYIIYACNCWIAE